jgi:hypothetical protein
MQKTAGVMAQVLEWLLIKCEALNSKPIATTKKTKTKQKPKNGTVHTL